MGGVIDDIKKQGMPKDMFIDMLQKNIQSLEAKIKEKDLEIKELKLINKSLIEQITAVKKNYGLIG